MPKDATAFEPKHADPLRKVRGSTTTQSVGSRCEAAFFIVVPSFDFFSLVGNGEMLPSLLPIFSCFCGLTPVRYTPRLTEIRWKPCSSYRSLNMQALADSKVLFEVNAANKIGIVTLNRPSALNAADLEVTSAIRIQWHAWEKSGDVQTAIFRGSGERAFCSGGDVKAMAATISREPESKLPQKALASEYLLLSEMSRSKIQKVAVLDGWWQIPNE
jgi:hypothetical protein